MSWIVQWDPKALKNLQKLGKPAASRILNYIQEHVIDSGDPRLSGEALTGNKVGLWRYRIGNYRIICKINDHMFVVLVLHAGHRKEVYKKNLHQ